MVTLLKLSGVVPGVLPTVVVVLDHVVVQGDGVAGGIKKALVSFAIYGWSTERAKGKSMVFPFSDMDQSMSCLTFWDEDILSVTTCMSFVFSWASLLARVHWL